MTTENRTPTQAVILAAGEGSRFAPFSRRPSHKSSLPLMGEAIIAQTVRALERAGIHDIVIIKSPQDTRLKDALHQSSSTTKVQFVNQEKPLGMGDALLSARAQLHDRFLVVNPQQINIAEHLSALQELQIPEGESPPILFTQTTQWPERYGIVKLEGSRVTQVIEKPENLRGTTQQRILGIYILNQDFIQCLQNRSLEPYQFEAALDAYAQQKTILAVVSDAQSLTLKYAWDLFAIAQYKFEQIPATGSISPEAQIHETALISGPVIIEAGAKIFEYAIIHGPAYIGKNAVVGSYCKVRNGTVLEEGVELQNAVEVKHSLVGAHTHIHSGFIGDSIIGENVRIGAGFTTANRRLDREAIRVLVKGAPIETATTFFGCLIGDRTSIGIHCGTNPGTSIEQDSTIYPMTLISNPKVE